MEYFEISEIQINFGKEALLVFWGGGVLLSVCNQKSFRLWSKLNHNFFIKHNLEYAQGSNIEYHRPEAYNGPLGDSLEKFYSSILIEIHTFIIRSIFMLLICVW